jgi:hypothetical protein
MSRTTAFEDGGRRRAAQPQGAPSQPAQDLRQLQRTAGNRAVGRLLRLRGATRQLSRWPSWAEGWLPDDPDAYDTFVGRVAAIAKRGRGPSEAELAELKDLRDRVARGSRLPELEKEVTLWPKQFKGMNAIIEIVTGAAEASWLNDIVEADKARFEEAAGGELKDALAADAKQYNGGATCLSYLYASGLTHLFGGRDKEIADVKDRYWTGAQDRKKTTSRHAKTLSRLAAELRIAGLVGPVRLLHWSKGHYDPRPTELFERLTNAGSGWYFFLASLGSYHTVIVAVNVAGASRTYYKIQDGGSVRKTAAELDEYIDDYGPIYSASTRIWQVYASP